MDPWNAPSPEQPLLGPRKHPPEMPTAALTYRKWQEKTGHALQSLLLHKIIIALIVLDATFVIIDLGYTTIHPDCDHPVKTPSPHWLQVLSHISLGITSLFLVEIPLTIWSLGVQYLNPFGPSPHAWLHFFDAFIIVTTFVLEVTFRGRDSELAGLLIILRLWRIVKLVTGVAVGAGEIDEEHAEELIHTKAELERMRVELAKSREENMRLQQRVATLQRR